MPSLQYIESFTVKGFRTKTQNCDEFNEKTAKLPGLWQQFYRSDLATNAKRLGVYSDYASDADGLYTVTAGVISNENCNEFDSVTIQAGNYLVFESVGPMPLAVIEAWRHIWAFFAKEKAYQRNFLSDFEEYCGLDKVTVYIGII